MGRAGGERKPVTGPETSGRSLFSRSATEPAVPSAGGRLRRGVGAPALRAQVCSHPAPGAEGPFQQCRQIEISIELREMQAQS